MKNLTVQAIIFQKILSCVSLCHKDFKKHLLIKVSIKNFSEYIFRQLKSHQHKIKSKIGISLEIALNVFKCLIVSLFPIKFLIWQQHHFCLFQLPSCFSVNLLWCTFYCVPRKKRCTLPSEGTDVHIQQYNHQKDLNLCLSLYYFGRVIVELEKNTNKDFNCVYGAYNLTKQHFEIPICFLFQLMSEQSFP